MINREVREWLDKVKRGQYLYDDAMCEFLSFAPILTREEMVFLKKQIEESYKS